MLIDIFFLFTSKKENYSRSELMQIVNDSDLSNKEKLSIIEILN
jgi:hypothetical protein